LTFQKYSRSLDKVARFYSSNLRTQYDLRRRRFDSS
jgi:hypothetical protein